MGIGPLLVRVISSLRWAVLAIALGLWSPRAWRAALGACPVPGCRPPLGFLLIKGFYTSYHNGDLVKGCFFRATVIKEIPS